MAMVFRVVMTIAPIFLGVFILSQGDSASSTIMGAIVIVGGLLSGALFWLDVRSRR